MLRDRGTECSIINKNIVYPWCHICKMERAVVGRHDKSGNRICANCYQKFIFSKHKQIVRDYNSRKGSINSPKRMIIQGRRIFLDRLVRKGKCSNCGKHIGDPYIDVYGKITIIKRTHMHHWFYLIIMPWACSVELCPSCHMKESWITGRFTKNKGV